MLKMNYKSYDTGDEKSNLECETVEKIEDFSVSYDGGRLNIMVNGKVLYVTNLAGNDFNVSVAVR